MQAVPHDLARLFFYAKEIAAELEAAYGAGASRVPIAPGQLRVRSGQADAVGGALVAVLIREQLQGSRCAHERIKELQRHVLTGQSLAILVERGGIMDPQDPCPGTSRNIMFQSLAKQPAEFA